MTAHGSARGALAPGAGDSSLSRLVSAPVERNLGEAMRLLLHFDAINVTELLEVRRVVEGTCARLAASPAT